MFTLICFRKLGGTRWASGKSGPLNNHVQDVLKKKNQKTDKVSAMFCLSPNYYLLLFNIERLQNSQYFCVFKYSWTVKQKPRSEAENRKQDWGETLRTCEACVLGMCETLTVVRLFIAWSSSSVKYLIKHKMHFLSSSYYKDVLCSYM